MHIIMEIVGKGSLTSEHYKNLGFDENQGKIYTISTACQKKNSMRN